MEDELMYNFDKCFLHGREVTAEEYWRGKAEELKMYFGTNAVVTPDAGGIKVENITLNECVGLSAYTHLCCFQVKELKDGGFYVY